MADNSWQARAMMRTHDCLEQHFLQRQDVAVCIDMLVYYLDERRPKSVAPDVFVAIGRDKRDRMTYKVWEEGGPPDFVLEVASPTTVKKDLAEKKAIYAQMGVREYWMFDPMGPSMGPLLIPRLQGLELAEGHYRALDELDRPGVGLARYSRVLDLEFHVRGAALRIWNPQTGEYLRTLEEETLRSRGLERSRDEEARRRRVAESRRDEEARRRKVAESNRDEEARLRRTAERSRDEEARRRRVAEQAALELQREIAELRSKFNLE